jgi:hypothetical protein
MNLLKELEEKLPMIEDKLKLFSDMLSKIPRMEDFLSKLNLQIKDINITEINAKLKQLQENKLDKDAMKDFTSRLSEVEHSLNMTMFSLKA